MWKWIKGLFANEIKSMRPDVPLNRKQRRVHASIERRKARKEKGNERSRNE